jgi:hypothetical protein
MRLARWIAFAFALIATIGTAAPRAQEPAPQQAFKTVHLVTLTDAEASTLSTALGDVNAAVAQAGHPEVRYRLFKVAGKQAGSHSHVWEASWPGGAVYDKVHASPAVKAAIAKHPVVEELRKNEVYNRYVEVTAAKR